MVQRGSPIEVREEMQSSCSHRYLEINRCALVLKLCAQVSQVFAELNKLVLDKGLRYLRIQLQGQRAPCCLQVLYRTLTLGAEIKVRVSLPPVEV